MALKYIDVYPENQSTFCRQIPILVELFNLLSFKYLIPFNNPLKACFSNKNYRIAIQTRTTQIVKVLVC